MGQRSWSHAVGFAGALAFASPAGAAEVFHDTTVTELTGVTATNPCNGEVITLDGVVHRETTLVQDSAGGRHRQETTVMIFSGAGSLGNEYSFKTVNAEPTLVRDPFPIVEHRESRTTVNARGGAPNFTTTLRYHFTWNANGDETAEFGFIDSRCSGTGRAGR